MAFKPMPGTGGTLAVTATTASTSLGSQKVIGSRILVVNYGTNKAFVAFGGSGVTATTTDCCIPTGQSAIFDVGDATFIAAICAATETATLNFCIGYES